LEAILKVRIVWGSLLLAFLCLGAAGQSAAPGPSATATTMPQEDSKPLPRILPIYHFSPTLKSYQPLTPGEKFRIATHDSIAPGTFVLAGLVAGESQWTNQNRSFGQGAAGFGRYFGAAYGDLVIGNYTTEAIFPTILHEDPRYFRRGTGSAWSRLRYAVGHTFWTQRDRGGMEFNFSEIAGASATVAISNAYYTDRRTAGDAAGKFGLRIGLDTAANIIYEFLPDLERKHRRRAK
jgi:hypothetical protein